MKFLWSGNPFKKDREEEAVAAALKNSYLFESFSAKEYMYLKDKLHVRKYNVGENVFEQHQPGTGMYVLVSGKVAIEEHTFFVDAKSGQETKKSKIIETLEPGDFFGELALIDDDHVRPATAKIIEPSLIVGFFKPDFMELLKQHPDTGAKLSLRLAKVASERLKDAVEEIKKARS
jgi:CRP/FNR family transcriptional regulator